MFVTFEGPEGGGKSTVLRAVAQRLESEGVPIVATREPGAGAVGEAIRNIILHSEDIDRHTELFLFLADRANHVETIVRPALAEGNVVLCDRFSDSTIVYQGHARGLAVEILRSVNLFATNGLKPDLTILFDIDPELGLSRLRTKDRLDSEPLAFHKRVRAGFLAEAEREPHRWQTIDASMEVESVIERVYQAIRQKL